MKVLVPCPAHLPELLGTRRPFEESAGLGQSSVLILRPGDEEQWLADTPDDVDGAQPCRVDTDVGGDELD